MTKIYFVTHPEVVIDPDANIEEWPLSELGKSRMKKMLKKDWIDDIEVIYSSYEQKAIDGALILAGHLDLQVNQLENLGENDRSSTGYLQEKEFWKVVEQFFASPEKSVRGWERAIDTQKRIVEAVDSIIKAHPDKTIAVISHGGVGALLLAYLTKETISKKFDQPGSGGGNYFVFEPKMKLLTLWESIS